MSTWPAVALGDVAKVSSGDGAPQEDSAFSSTGTPFIRAGSLVTLTHGTSEEQLELIPEAEAARRRMRVYPPKTVVFAKSGMSCTKGLVHELRCKAHVVNHLAAVECGSDLESRFLLRWFETYTPARLIANPAYPSIKISDIRAEKIPLPPLPEQKRIVKILDAADALRAKRRESLAQLDTLLQSTFLDMFGDPVTNPKGWAVKMLGDLGTLDRGVSKHRPRNDPALLGGLHPLIQTGEVANSEGYIRSYTSTYSDLGLKQSRMWSAGTLCITIAANIANTGILTFDACFPDSVVGFSSANKGRVEYVQGLFWFLRNILERKAPQSAQKNINLKILRGLLVPVPFDELQHRFASIVEAVNHQKARLRAHLAELDTLFASLQARAFNGEL